MDIVKKMYDSIAAGDLDSKLVLIKPKILPNVPEDTVGPDDWEVRGVVEDAFRSMLIGDLEPVLNEPTGNEEEDYNRHDLEHVDQHLDGLSYAAQARWFRLAIDGKIHLPEDYKNYKMLWQVIPYEFAEFTDTLPEVKSVIVNQRTDFENDAILYLEDDFLKNADNIRVVNDNLINGRLTIWFDEDPSIGDAYDGYQHSYASFCVDESDVGVTLKRWEENPRIKGRVDLSHYEERTLKSLDELIILCDSIKDGSIVIEDYYDREW